MLVRFLPLGSWTFGLPVCEANILCKHRRPEMFGFFFFPLKTQSKNISAKCGAGKRNSKLFLILMHQQSLTRPCQQIWCKNLCESAKCDFSQSSLFRFCSFSTFFDSKKPHYNLPLGFALQTQRQPTGLRNKSWSQIFDYNVSKLVHLYWLEEFYFINKDVEVPQGKKKKKEIN